MPGDSALFLNGRSVDMEIYDIFTLLEIMTEEAKLVEGMHSLGAKVGFSLFVLGSCSYIMLLIEITCYIY